jgi:acetamidase/formamidase
MFHHFKPSKYYQTYGPNPPVLRIKSGDTLVADTLDAGGFDNQGVQIATEMRQNSPDTIYNSSNPLTGPFYVEDAEPGDTITIEIKNIKLTRPNAWSRVATNFGGLTEEAPGRMLLYNDPIPINRYEWNLNLEAMTATTTFPRSKYTNPTIPLHPFIGSIGVAPRYGRVEMSLTPGEYGGNMDCPDVCEGAILNLPVNHRGALLVFGDVHAAQGDGELCGVALETSAELTIKVCLTKSSIEWPRINNDDYIMVVGSSRPLMEAYKIAHVELINWLTTEYGYDKWDAVQLLSQVGRCRIANTVDPNYSVVAKFPRYLLPS